MMVLIKSVDDSLCARWEFVGLVGETVLGLGCRQSVFPKSKIFLKSNFFFFFLNSRQS